MHDSALSHRTHPAKAYLIRPIEWPLIIGYRHVGTRHTGNEITSNHNSPRLACSLEWTRDTAQILFGPLRDNVPMKLNDLQ
ncbi:hypothetical protein CEXT_382071 [Caerostris extrusa]|uniref:Uncharacterized protein n=1 Tax=Caerostris extrusa TaxID=172846 RepID=A0AAV4VJF3_CAEEX|nr:hypothetical protein CEXT_382071 [Caerostris extrusa]